MEYRKITCNIRKIFCYCGKRKEIEIVVDPDRIYTTVVCWLYKIWRIRILVGFKPACRICTKMKDPDLGLISIRLPDLWHKKIKDPDPDSVYTRLPELKKESGSGRLYCTVQQFAGIRIRVPPSLSQCKI